MAAPRKKYVCTWPSTGLHTNRQSGLITQWVRNVSYRLSRYIPLCIRMRFYLFLARSDCISTDVHYLSSSSASPSA